MDVQVKKDEAMAWCNQYIKLSEALINAIKENKVSQVTNWLEERKAMLEKAPDFTALRDSMDKVDEIIEKLRFIKSLDDRSKLMLGKRMEDSMKDISGAKKYRRTFYSNEKNTVSKFFDKKS